ncbi:MAG: MBL fold metallo-hydrolase [Firmicutes bacterium]|nr:MBL fold metallo-hydrolase [Bacillota bacterium]
MKVTYIHHSSFLVETEKFNLLFDYAGGGFPVLNTQKPLFVFVSHAHSDHFSKEIFSLQKIHPNVKYIISNDIPKRSIDNSAEVFSIAPNSQISVCGVDVKTLKSTDEGVAFFVSCSGEKIYHAGDLNNWRWEGEPEQWNNEMEISYINEISKLKGECPKAAFLPLDPRQGNAFSLCIEQFMKIVGAKNIFPMHFWEDYSVCQKAKALPQTKEFSNRIIEISHKGQKFEI